MIPAERVYMQFVPKVSAAIREVQSVETWMKSQKGIKTYCDANPEEYQATLKLLSQAEQTLRKTINVFMKGQPVIV